MKDAKESFQDLQRAAFQRAAEASEKYPQPNYTLSKVAEEAGEVVKAAIHAAEGRGKYSEIREEIIDLLAMLYRLWREGDETRNPPIARMQGNLTKLISEAPMRQPQQDTTQFNIVFVLAFAGNLCGDYSYFTTQKGGIEMYGIALTHGFANLVTAVFQLWANGDSAHGLKPVFSEV